MMEAFDIRWLLLMVLDHTNIPLFVQLLYLTYNKDISKQCPVVWLCCSFVLIIHAGLN